MSAKPVLTVGPVIYYPFSTAKGIDFLVGHRKITSHSNDGVGCFVVVLDAFADYIGADIKVNSLGLLDTPEKQLGAIAEGSVDTVSISMIPTDQRLKKFAMPIIIGDLDLVVAFKKVFVQVHPPSVLQEIAILLAVIMFQMLTKKVLSYIRGKNSAASSALFLASLFVWIRTRTGIYNMIIFKGSLEKFGIPGKNVRDLIRLIRKGFKHVTVSGYIYIGILDQFLSLESGHETSAALEYFNENIMAGAGRFRLLMENEPRYLVQADYTIKASMHRFRFSDKVGYFSIDSDIKLCMAWRNDSRFVKRFDHFLLTARQTGLLSKLVKLHRDDDPPSHLHHSPLTIDGSKVAKYATLYAFFIFVASATDIAVAGLASHAWFRLGWFN